MIRALDSKGRLVIGVPRATLRKLLEGPDPARSEPQDSEDSALVVLIYAGETDEHILEKICADYNRVPDEVVDRRTKREPVPDVIVCWHEGCEKPALETSDYCEDHQR